MRAVVIPIRVSEFSESKAAIERYQDAYRAAEKAVAFGETVRLGGIFLGGVVFVIALVAFILSPAAHSGFPVVSILLLPCTVLLVLAAHVLGMGLCVQGQLLKAALDSDVNSSPFLSNAQRAKAMSLGTQLWAPTQLWALDSIALRAA